MLPYFLAAATPAAAAATIDIDIQQKYGAISIPTINRAIDEARRHFRDSPDDRIILHLPAGVFPLTSEGSSIDVSNVRPGPAGRLTLRGAGQDRTTLVFDTRADEIIGRNTYHVAFEGLHFTLDHMTVSQGHVEAVEPGSIILRIEDGFPTPADLFDPDIDRGRYLRRCTDSPSAPHIEQGGGNAQVPWTRAEPLSPGRWRLDVRAPRGEIDYRPGDLLAIKSKNVDGGAYRFIGGEDVTFDDVLWSRATRGVFRGGMSGVKILNSAIRRDQAVDGQVPCLASAAGGPQIGQPRDLETTGNIVENFTATGTGDDALAFFNASGTVNNATIADSFARGILLYNSPGVVLTNIHVDHAPVLRQ